MWWCGGWVDTGWVGWWWVGGGGDVLGTLGLGRQAQF